MLAELDVDAAVGQAECEQPRCAELVRRRHRADAALVKLTREWWRSGRGLGSLLNPLRDGRVWGCVMTPSDRGVVALGTGMSVLRDLYNYVCVCM